MDGILRPDVQLLLGLGAQNRVPIAHAYKMDSDAMRRWTENAHPCTLSTRKSWCRIIKNQQSGAKTEKMAKVERMSKSKLYVVMEINLKKTFLYIYCVNGHGMRSCNTMYVKVRSQLVESVLSFRFYVDPGNLTGHQAWVEVVLATEPSCQL